MTANGFSPADLAIKVGDTVMFKNDDTRDHWPASDPHPIHNICPGFDALGGVPPGGNYSYTFTVAKQCPFHDHLMPRTKGSITVTQ
jgi:plastocyanin